MWTLNMLYVGLTMTAGEPAGRLFTLNAAAEARWLRWCSTHLWRLVRTSIDGQCRVRCSRDNHRTTCQSSLGRLVCLIVVSLSVVFSDWVICSRHISGLENGSPSTINVVFVFVLVGIVVIRFLFTWGSVVSGPIVMKLFTHINDSILHQATVADFWVRPQLIISN